MCSLSIPPSSLCTACSRAHVWIDCLFLLPTFMLSCSVLIFNVLCFSSPFPFPFFSSLGFLLCLLLLLFSVCPCVLITISLCAQCDSVLYVLCHVFVVLLLLPFFFALSLFCLPSLPLGLVSSFFFNHYAQAVFFVGVSPGRVPGLKYRRRNVFFPHSIRLPARAIMKHWVSTFIINRLTVGLFPTQV